MSILLVNDFNIFNHNSLSIVESVSLSLKKFFSGDEFLKDYSEFIFSIYFAIDYNVKVSLFKSPHFCELYWYPISNSCLNFVSLYDKVSNYILENTDPINMSKNRSAISDENSLELEPVRKLLNEIMKSDIKMEHRIYGSDRTLNVTGNIADICIESSIKKNDNLFIGRDRRLLILWIISFENYCKRKRVNDLPAYEELYESSIIPNVEIKYIVLKNDDGVADSSYGNEYKDNVIFINQNEKDDLVYCSILNIISGFYFSEKHTIVFSPVSTLNEIGYSEDLSVLISKLYPSIAAFPIFVHETCTNLSLPPFSTMVGVLSHKKYQPLPVVTRRLIQLMNSSEGKKEAVKSIIISLYKCKLAIALELNESWYALLISITIGSNLHLAIDILRPGYIIAE